MSCMHDIGCSDDVGCPLCTTIYGPTNIPFKPTKQQERAPELLKSTQDLLEALRSLPPPMTNEQREKAAIEWLERNSPAGWKRVERAQVNCDKACGALLEPVTLEEHKVAVEHWRNHTSHGGVCSHG